MLWPFPCFIQLDLITELVTLIEEHGAYAREAILLAGLIWLYRASAKRERRLMVLFSREQSNTQALSAALRQIQEDLKEHHASTSAVAAALPDYMRDSREARKEMVELLIRLSERRNAS